jgi:hypothetical protein
MGALQKQPEKRVFPFQGGFLFVFPCFLAAIRGLGPSNGISQGEAFVYPGCNEPYTILAYHSQRFR